MSLIAAEAFVQASPDEIFAYLSDLENHWQLADRFIEVIALDRESPSAKANGGTVRMRGPFGLERTATTRVVSANRNHSMRGTAELGKATRARIEWRFAPELSGTRVHLRAEVERASATDHLLLLAGGAAWLRRRFAKILQALATRFSA
jgi:ribosome-associated toxin RatA of RatAB toxin-antitoxin module